MVILSKEDSLTLSLVALGVLAMSIIATENCKDDLRKWVVGSVMGFMFAMEMMMSGLSPVMVFHHRVALLLIFCSFIYPTTWEVIAPFYYTEASTLFLILRSLRLGGVLVDLCFVASFFFFRIFCFVIIMADLLDNHAPWPVLYLSFILWGLNLFWAEKVLTNVFCGRGRHGRRPEEITDTQEALGRTMTWICSVVPSSNRLITTSLFLSDIMFFPSCRLGPLMLLDTAHRCHALMVNGYTKSAIAYADVWIMVLFMTWRIEQDLILQWIALGLSTIFHCFLTI